MENGAEGIQTYLPRPWPQISIPFNFYGKVEESQSFFLFALKKAIHPDDIFPATARFF